MKYNFEERLVKYTLIIKIKKQYAKYSDFNEFYQNVHFKRLEKINKIITTLLITNNNYEQYKMYTTYING